MGAGHPQEGRVPHRRNAHLRARPTPLSTQVIVHGIIKHHPLPPTHTLTLSQIPPAPNASYPHVYAFCVGIISSLLHMHTF